MNRSLSLNKYMFIAILTGIGTCVLLSTLTYTGITEQFSDVTSIICCAIFTVLIVMIMRGVRLDFVAQKFIFPAYLIRISLLVVDYLEGDIIGKLLNIRDYKTFEAVALRYYKGDFSSGSTNYPYIMNALFHVFGPNTFINRLVNILLSVLTMIVMYKFLQEMQIEKKCRLLALAILSFSPYTIVYSILSMRESFYLFFITFSFCLFCKWKLTGNDKYIYYTIVSVAPVLYLHSGYISFPILYLFYYVFDKSKGNKKGLFVIFIRITVCIAIIFFLSQLQSMHYLFRNGQKGLIYSIQTTYRQHSNQGGGSQYLSWMRASNPLQILLFTPIRMLYFLISPVIFDWRGAVDLISFLTDGLLHLTSLVCTLIYMRRFKKGLFNGNHGQQHYYICKWAILLICMTALVFSWGVTTAGAAIRHRNCLIGIECIGLGVFFYYRMPTNRLTL